MTLRKGVVKSLKRTNWKPAPPIDFLCVYEKNPAFCGLSKSAGRFQQDGVTPIRSLKKNGNDFMKARPDKNSATSAVAGFAGVIDDAILPPAGVELRSDKEHLIWNQFTRARQGRLA